MHRRILKRLTLIGAAGLPAGACEGQMATRKMSIEADVVEGSMEPADDATTQGMAEEEPFRGSAR